MKLKLAAFGRTRKKPAATGSYRVALHGFSDFERNALSFCLKHAADREPAYLQVERAADADFIVADASHEAIATSVTRGARLHDTLFVGEHAPAGARSRVGRPIDPEHILRALDEMAAERNAARPAAPGPDIVLPMAEPESGFPVLSASDIVDTAPAAFDHGPMFVKLDDLAPIARPRPASTTTPAKRESPVDPSSDAPAAPSFKATPGIERRAGKEGSADASAPDVAPTTARAVEGIASQPAALEPATDQRRTTRLALVRQPASSEPETIAGVGRGDHAALQSESVAPKPSMTPQERAEAKAAARRRSRRARLAQAGHSPGPLPQDVLLLCPPRTDDGLGAQLERFGFRVHLAKNGSQALDLVASLPLACVFLDVAPGSDEDMDGLELCMEIKHQRVALAGPVPPVFLLANRDSAAGRVRAKLAGCDALLIRPVSRGDAARALEACDVALPKDERRVERS